MKWVPLCVWLDWSCCSNPCTKLFVATTMHRIHWNFTQTCLGLVRIARKGDDPDWPWTWEMAVNLSLKKKFSNFLPSVGIQTKLGRNFTRGKAHHTYMKLTCDWMKSGKMAGGLNIKCCIKFVVFSQIMKLGLLPSYISINSCLE